MLTAVDPTAGVATAVVAHHLTENSIDAGWRAAAQELWLEVLTEEGDERRKQFREVENEFHRHHYIIEWLKEELADVIERVELLETAALNRLGLGEALARSPPADPRMRPYLKAALRNTLTASDHFSPSWIRRLVTILGSVGFDHLEVLLAMNRLAIKQHTQSTRPLPPLSQYVDVREDEEVKGLLDDSVLGEELEHMKLAKIAKNRGSAGRGHRLLPRGRRLILFVDGCHGDDA